MSDLDRSTVREQLKNISEDEYIRANTRDVLNEKAGILGVEDPASLGTKKEVYDAMVASADLPDPSLRGKSTIDSPVATVWDIADQMITQARANGEEPARRKDVLEAAQKMGVAFYTARTQYQAWFTATNRGTRVLAEIPNSELPQALQRADEGGGDVVAEGDSGETEAERREAERREGERRAKKAAAKAAKS